MERAVQVGDGFIASCGSDRTAYTVIEVKTPKKIIVQRDKEGERLDPEGGPTGYNAAIRDPEGATRVYTLRKNDRWMEKGVPMSSWWITGSVVEPGTQKHYRDPHF